VQRAQIILSLGGGSSVNETARRLGVDRKTVRLWRDRYCRERLAGLEDRSRSGRPPVIEEEQVVELHRLACELRADKRPRTQAEMARVVGISRSWTGELLRRAALKPWQVKSWCHSPDPNFRAITRRVCRLYRRKPPKNTVILSLDEKTCIQALERSYGRGARPGRPARRQADYRRRGTTNLFAALEIHTGRVHSRISQRKRACDFIAFLRQLDRTIPAGLRIVLVLDNISTHPAKHARAWLAQRPGRFELVFTPLHASWLNQIELFFSKLTRQLLHRASFNSLDQLKRALRNYVTRYNRRPQPIKWTFRGWPKEGRN